jgi:predicted nucleic acid-binding protein
VALIVLDAGVLIAHIEAQDPFHVVAVHALETRSDDDMVLPASAYSELLVRPAREGRLGAVRDAVHVLALRVVPIDATIAEQAAALRAERPALRLPDALVLACADALGADEVLTTDRRCRDLPRVRVLEPTPP